MLTDLFGAALEKQSQPLIQELRDVLNALLTEQRKTNALLESIIKEPETTT
jgi:hypothetical protein